MTCCDVLLELVAFAAFAAEKIVEVGLDQPVEWLSETVDHPCAFAFGFDKAKRLHDRELLGHLHLSGVEYFLQMADAEWAIIQEIDDAEPLWVGDALVNIGGFHAINIFRLYYILSMVYARRSKALPA